MARSDLDTRVGRHMEQAAPPRLWLGVHLHGRAVVLAGLSAGFVFLVLELLTAMLFATGTPFGPAHVTLRGLVGAKHLPGQYDPGLVLAGLFIHFLLSVLVILPLAVFIHPWKKRYLAAAVGFVYGYVLYFINFFLFALAVPLLATARDLFMVVDYALFGMVAARLYVTFRDRMGPHRP